MTCFSKQNFHKGLYSKAWLTNILMGVHVNYITGCYGINVLLAED